MGVPPKEGGDSIDGRDDERGEGSDGFQHERLQPEERAAIAAVDGLGSLSPFDADTVDQDEVARFEAAAGALFMAFSRERGALDGPPASVQRRLQERLEDAADMYVSSRLSEGREEAGQRERALGAADAEAADRRAAGHSFADTSARGVVTQPPTPGADDPKSLGTLPSPRPSLLPVLAGWAAAAALLVGLLITARRASELERGVASLQAPSTRLAQLQMTAPDLLELGWKPLGAGSTVSGSVIWSDERNEGYMRLKGLPMNDPTGSQYQLWIFRSTDPGAEAYPVDGGVFDVAESGEVIVPINAKLHVGRAGAFAVTVEQPGGVVVSGREEIVALAQRAS